MTKPMWPHRSITRQLSKLKRPLIAGPATKTRELVLNVLLWVTITLLGLATLLLIWSYFTLGNSYVAGRIFVLGFLFCSVCSLYFIAQRGWYRTAAMGLIGCYFATATMMTVAWGIDVPVGILLYGLIVTLSGVLLGARYGLYMAGLVIATLIFVFFLAAIERVTPDRYWAHEQADGTDIVGFAFVFILQAVVSWLFNFRMERALQLALKAEEKLASQNEMLESTVSERTRELQEVQLEKTQQVYRFAELGQLSMGLLHDLANNLTILNIDLEELSGHDHSKKLRRVQKGVADIEALVRQVRDQLQDTGDVTTFNIKDEVDKVIASLQYKADHHGIALRLAKPISKRLTYTGDPIRFRQMVTNVISNGIDAYTKQDDVQQEVSITVTAKPSALSITVSDTGKGISDVQQRRLFEPFHGTNPSGMGLGLYIARRIAEDSFGGTILLTSQSKPTTFVMYMRR